MAEVRLRAAGLGDKTVIASLLQLLLHDLSAYDGDGVNEHGLFDYPYLDFYWVEPEVRFPFLFAVDGALAGFALVRRRAPALVGSGGGDAAAVAEGEGEPAMVTSMAEFFVLNRFRGLGIGRAVAMSLFEQFGGRWEIPFMSQNDRAGRFWESAVSTYVGHPVAAQALAGGGEGGEGDTGYMLIAFDASSGRAPSPHADTQAAAAAASEQQESQAATMEGPSVGDRLPVTGTGAVAAQRANDGRTESGRRRRRRRVVVVRDKGKGKAKSKSKSRGKAKGKAKAKGRGRGKAKSRAKAKAKAKGKQGGTGGKRRKATAGKKAKAKAKARTGNRGKQESRGKAGGQKDKAKVKPPSERRHVLRPIQTAGAGNDESSSEGFFSSGDSAGTSSSSSSSSSSPGFFVEADSDPTSDGGATDYSFGTDFEDVGRPLLYPGALLCFVCVDAVLLAGRLPLALCFENEICRGAIRSMSG